MPSSFTHYFPSLYCIFSLLFSYLALLAFCFYCIGLFTSSLFSLSLAFSFDASFCYVMVSLLQFVSLLLFIFSYLLHPPSPRRCYLFPYTFFPFFTLFSHILSIVYTYLTFKHTTYVHYASPIICTMYSVHSVPPMSSVHLCTLSFCQKYISKRINYLYHLYINVLSFVFDLKQFILYFYFL